MPFLGKQPGDTKTPAMTSRHGLSMGLSGVLVEGGADVLLQRIIMEGFTETRAVKTTVTTSSPSV